MNVAMESVVISRGMVQRAPGEVGDAGRWIRLTKEKGERD